MKNKKAQVGETITWIVATVIIIFVLVISIFTADFFLGKSKEIKESYFQTADILASKSLFSYMLTSDSEGKKVYTQIKEEGSFSNFNGNLALKIFRGLYVKDYNNYRDNIWLGIVIKTEEKLNGESCLNEKKFCMLNSIENNFFGERSGGSSSTEIGYHVIPYTSEKIKLNETHSIELFLRGK